MKNRSFTFIELLVAISIFSIIASGLYYSLHMGARVWARGDEIIKENQEIRTFFNAISADLVNANLYSGQKTEWGADKITFFSLVNIYSEGKMRKGLVKVSYFMDSDSGGIVRALAGRQEGFKEESAEKEIVLHSIGSMSFKYPYKISDDLQGEYEWRDSWQSERAAKNEGLAEVGAAAVEETVMPRGVNIRVEIASSGSTSAENASSGGAAKIFEKTVFIPIGKLGETEEESNKG